MHQQFTTIDLFFLMTYNESISFEAEVSYLEKACENVYMLLTVDSNKLRYL